MEPNEIKNPFLHLPPNDEGKYTEPQHMEAVRTLLRTPGTVSQVFEDSPVLLKLLMRMVSLPLIERQMIRVHFIGPTNHKPARWVATGGGKRRFHDYDYASGQYNQRLLVAQALADGLDWGVVMPVGSFNGCYFYTTL